MPYSGAAYPFGRLWRHRESGGRRVEVFPVKAEINQHLRGSAPARQPDPSRRTFTKLVTVQWTGFGPAALRLWRRGSL